MASVEGMDTDRIPELGEAVSEGPDRWNFSGLDTGVKEKAHTRLPPTGGHHLQVVVELTKDQMAMAVDQEGGRRSHGSGTAVAVDKTAAV